MNDRPQCKVCLLPGPVRQQVDDHLLSGGTIPAARKIAQDQASDTGIRRHRDQHLAGTPVSTDRGLIVGKIAELVEKSGIDVDAIGKVNRVNIWQAMSKDDDGEPVVTDLVAVQLSPAWAEGPQWPVVQQAPSTVVRAPKLLLARHPDGFKVAVTIPDMQVGYFTDPQGVLIPIHDERVLDLALQVVAAVRPDRIVLHGDNIDGSEWGRYRQHPAFARTTQATIDRNELWCAMLRAHAGDECVIDWIEGNHEARIPNLLIDNAVAAFGLRRGNVPADWPVMSVPHLCRLDEHGVNYHSGYPAASVYINRNLHVVHGDRVASNGSTAHKYLANERVSVVYGHVHRREWAERTRNSADGPKTILAMSPGCACRTDGVVPSTKGGMDLFGQPVPSTEDWQQGLAIFTYEDGDGRFIPEQVPIHDGWTIWRGSEYRSRVDLMGAPVSE